MNKRDRGWEGVSGVVWPGMLMNIQIMLIDTRMQQHNSYLTTLSLALCIMN